MDKSKSIYIDPNLFLFNNLSEVEESRTLNRFYADKKKRIKSFADILILDNALILGEPGFGKSELLRHIHKEAHKSGLSSIYIELKGYTHERSLEEYINEEAIISGQNFLINDGGEIICLDALDEVRGDARSEMTRHIKIFKNLHPEVKIYLSCRLHPYQKFPDLDDLNVPIVYINKFTFREARKYLQAHSFSDQIIDQIITEFREPYWDSIILIPRYLEKLVSFYKSTSNLRIKPTKSDLYNKFVEERLHEECEKKRIEYSELFRNFLEKLALINEIYQTNEISKKELISVLDDIKSNIASALLNQKDLLPLLYNSSLILDKGETITFEDHSLQEYLASCELLRLGGSKRIYDLAVIEQLHEINPSWINTLIFVLDQDSSLIEDVLVYGRRYNLAGKLNTLPLFYSELLTRVDISKLKKEEGERIFKKIIRQYQDDCIWIEWEIAERLLKLYTSNLYPFLSSFTDERRLKRLNPIEQYVKKGNVVLMIGLLLEKKDKKLLSDEQQSYWKKKLIKYANDKNENGVLQRHALFALEQFRDSKIIAKVENIYNHKSDMVGERFLNFCKETDPNHEISIKYFIAALKDASINRSVAALYGIYAINSRKAIIKFLKLLTEDEVLLRKLVDHDHEESEKFVSNISQVYCKSIKDLLLEIIFRILDIYQYNSLFLIQIAKLLQEKEKNIVTILFQELRQTSKPTNYLFELDNIFTSLLKLEDVECFCGNIKRFKDAQWIGYRFLNTIRHTRGEKGEKIYEEGKKYLQEAYEIAEARQRNLKNQPSEEQKQYEKFKERLKKATTKNDAFVLKFYFQNSDLIEKFISKTELAKIKKLTIGFIGF